MIFAKDRAELVAATKALDRVLLWNHYVVPQWTYGKQRTARWDRFGRPETDAAIRRVGVPDDLVVGCGEGRQDGIAARASVPARARGESTRAAVVLGGRRARRRSAASFAGARAGGRDRTARHLGVRRSAISRRTSSISTTSIRTRRKAALFSQIGPQRSFNQNFLTFNSLNSFILKGDAAQGMELTFATLMATRAGDEPDAMYGLAARAVRISADGLTYRFLLRPEASFHDGSRSPRTMSPSRSIS